VTAQPSSTTAKGAAETRAGSPPPTPETRVIGEKRTPLRDFYHVYLRLNWAAALGLIVIGYLALNLCFAILYLFVGGVAGARPGSLADAFAFSIQTMGTIGYGAMYPTGATANAIVVLESVTGLIVTAVATGLVFAKFSQSGARVVFTNTVTIAPMNGVPTLMLRLGNERKSQIMDARLKVIMYKTERTTEGVLFYRMIDLPLSRDQSPALSRTWTVLHPIVPSSPLHGATPESLQADEVELLVTLVGVDDTSLQPVHARKGYATDAFVWGARHADLLSEGPDGGLVVDLRKFHEHVPTAPTHDFPYPRQTG
jgi:inward rectifier potassium channel